MNGPFNEFDFQNPGCLRNKLLKQTKVPVYAAVALDLDGDEDCSLPPYLPLIPDADLLEAAKCLTPVAKGDFRALNICFDDITQCLIETQVVLQIVTSRLLGGFLNELHCRGIR